MIIFAALWLSILTLFVGLAVFAETITSAGRFIAMIVAALSAGAALGPSGRWCCGETALRRPL